MKIKKILYECRFLAAFIMISFIFFSCSSTKKTEKMNPEIVGSMINAKNFTFVAERVNPFRGTSRNLTSSYDVKITRDTVNSFLPYFGRAYQAPIDPSKGGITFTSLNFSYSVADKSKDEWDIYIEPRDISDVETMIFRIFGNGTATLNVQNTHRDPISFYGHVEKNKD